MVASTDPHLRVNELTLGSGGLCGSVYLNKRFEELVRSRVGKQIDALSKSESLEAMDEVGILLPAHQPRPQDRLTTYLHVPKIQRVFNDEVRIRISFPS